MSARRKKLLPLALLLALAIRSALAFRPMNSMIHWVDSHPRACKTQYDLADIVWAIQAVDRRCAFATCLVNGLVAQYLCSKNSIPSTLHIGVKKGGEKELRAHAWVTVEERVVVGAVHDLDSYTPLPPLRGKL